MNRIALGLVLAVSACAAVAAQQSPPAAASSDATRAIVKSYLEIQGHLAADRFQDAKGPARTLAAQAAALGKDGAALAKAATAFEAAADVKTARDAFASMSEAVIARVKADGSPGAAADLRLAYCPMVNRSWLQREEQIRNPYYGSQMLSCGEFKPLR